MEESEKAVKPPTSPITVRLNQFVLSTYFKWFVKKYLPAFKVVITSGYRAPDKNAEVGGVENSAHLHGLAYDIILQKPDGAAITRDQARKVFADFIAPNWGGYALWEDGAGADGKKTWHIHLNLSRRVTEYASIFGISVIGIVGFKFFSSMGDPKNE